MRLDIFKFQMRCRIVPLIHFFPKIIFTIAAPIFRSIPDLLVGIPVSRANFCYTWVIPTIRFHENENPLITIYLIVILDSIVWLLLFSNCAQTVQNGFSEAVKKEGSPSSTLTTSA